MGVPPDGDGEELAIIYGLTWCRFTRACGSQGCVLTEAGERYVALGRKRGDHCEDRGEGTPGRGGTEGVDHIKDREPQGARS